MYSISLTLFFLAIPTIMFFMNLVLSKKDIINQEKSSPFECGFDPASPNRQPFSIQFFMISMLFLIFDVEIALLIPLIPLNNPRSISTIILASFFLLILILGLYYEYMDNSIDWKI